MDIYERIKQRRIELGMSQDQLARLVGYETRGAISRIESGTRKINNEQIVAFANALQTTPLYLMGIEEEYINPNESSRLSKHVGEIVKSTMINKGYNETVLAALIGISVDEVTNIIEGKNSYFSLELLSRFSKVLGVPQSHFVNILTPVRNIGINMAHIRMLSGITQEQLANKTNIPLTRYINIEGGSQVSFSEIQKFADCYCIPTALVIGYDYSKADEKNIHMLRMLSHVHEWVNTVEETVFTEEEMKEIMNYAKFVVSKRG